MKYEHSAFQILQMLLTRGIGPAKVRAAIERARASRITLGDLVADPNKLSSFLSTEQITDLQKTEVKARAIWGDLGEMEVVTMSILDEEYPGFLRSLLNQQAPLLLFARGNLDLFEKASVGFCGSRKASDKGIQVARECAEILSRQKINVVSGYASGVDMTAHRAALEVSGTTTIVLAEGIFRHRVKLDLKDSWDWDRALVISEYLPKMTWNVGNAMRRNQLICALCRAMILIEAGETGGSIEAGRECLRRGIPLFAPVYDGMPESAKGNRILLGEGAHTLYKKRSTNLPNLKPVLSIFNGEVARSSPPPLSSLAS